MRGQGHSQPITGRNSIYKKILLVSLDEIRLIMVAIKKYHKVYIIEAVVVKPKGWPFK